MKALVKMFKDICAALSEPWNAPRPVEGPPGTMWAGKVQDDGTVYAGIDPQTGREVFTTPKDTEVVMAFGNKMLRVEFGAVAGAATQLNRVKKFGHRDWIIPTKEQMEVLQTAHRAIGGFENNGYWTSSELCASNAWMAFVGGKSLGLSNQNKGSRAHVRCIRLGDIPPPPPPPEVAVHTNSDVKVGPPLRLKLGD